MTQVKDEIATKSRNNQMPNLDLGNLALTKALIEQVLKKERKFVLLKGDCRKLLDFFPEQCIDCVITSPPYWKMRIYHVEPEHQEREIGSEENPEDYVTNVASVFTKIKRILKPTGSVWLNIGDKFYNKNLMGMPWRVALAMQEDGWILRNDVIWNKMKGTQSAKNRLRSNYEHLFHFVKRKAYYYNYNGILIKPTKLPKIDGDKAISASGVSGRKYREQISRSESLNENERRKALAALEEVIQSIRDGKIVDFRMTIRGNQRPLHSDNGEISGRARELETKGFYILTSKAKGFIPADIWEIVPEDEWRKDVHYAVFPVELLRIPINATCPSNGVILDPFVGIGSTVMASVLFSRRAIGIDISKRYLEIASERLQGTQTKLSSD